MGYGRTSQVTDVDEPKARIAGASTFAQASSIASQRYQHDLPQTLSLHGISTSTSSLNSATCRPGRGSPGTRLPPGPIVALSATAPDPINDSRRFLPWQWVFWFHQLTPDGCLWPVCHSNPKWCEKALARFYGLPKVHKDGAPLRSIVSLKGTPTCGLAKWLFRRLKFLTAESDTTVSSSAEFLEKLKGLLKLCLRTYFTFYGTIYEQVKGTPMGSPISGFIAEAVLQRLESLVFQHHRPKFWARYVDDTFVVIERDQVLTFQEHLNAVFLDIQFTMEEEENNQLAFLDVLVCRKDCGGLKTKVFRKATNTMQVLNFNSNHPISHKRSCVRTLYRRVETHCSEPEDKIAELQYLRRVFKANGYPRNFVDRCIRKRDERPNRTDTKSWRGTSCVSTRRYSALTQLRKAKRPAATAGNVWSRLPDLV
nr:unnamed protein product [Spirometra erinaceieuropaei]